MGILDNAKQVAKAVEEIHNLELYQRVLNLHSDIIELVEENNRLRAENEEVHKTLRLRKKMEFKEPFYYQEGDETPFCPSCMESNDLARDSSHLCMTARVYGMHHRRFTHRWQQSANEQAGLSRQ